MIITVLIDLRMEFPVILQKNQNHIPNLPWCKCIPLSFAFQLFDANQDM